MASKSLPSAFGRYQVLGELGTGAMGEVFLAMDSRLGRPVAIKVLKVPMEFESAPAEFEVRFRREAEAAGRMSHANIVQVFDVGPNFLVMEYLEGETLASTLRRGAPMSLRRIATVVLGAAGALDFAHQNGIIHRDVKPANIMLTNDGVVKVMDFGVARLDDSKLTVIGTVMGSIQYMAPEQMTGGTVDGRADVYSLAAVAYEMLTGGAPFPGKTITEVVSLAVQEKFQPPRTRDARLPEAINRVFERGLTANPAKRYPTAAEFARDLLAALDPVLDLVAATPGTAAPSEAAPPEGGTLLVSPHTFSSHDAEARREGVLILDSEPSGAAVFVDGYEVGQTPIAKLDTRLGGHAVRFQAKGHQPLTIQTELSNQHPVRMVMATLPPDQSPATWPGKLVPFGPGVIPPVRISGETPVHPEDARSRGVSGAVTVEFWVSESGDARDARVVVSAGPLLDSAVVEAVGKWKFTPARLNGMPVSMKLTAQHAFGAPD